MRWNWQLANWPDFHYHSKNLVEKERQFLLNAGRSLGTLKSIGEDEYAHFMVEILTIEGQESSRIEGELLDRESLQSSIRQHFNLKTHRRQEDNKESRMAQLLLSVYETFQKPLSHQMLWHWHAKLFHESARIESRGQYRKHEDPMQIVSHRYDSPKIFFEAPPSAAVLHEMTHFIEWFNHPKPNESLLARAAIAHVYFESIHPFEDGNGRIGRALVEKILSQAVGRPVLIAVSKVLEKRKKEYYAALERCNRTLEVTPWVDFFTSTILEAQENASQLLAFILYKAHFMSRLAGQLNPRQEKALLRVFAEGPNGFAGGLSAEKYIAITKTSRATATRDLADLIEKGALKKTGELRHTRYWINFD